MAWSMETVLLYAITRYLYVMIRHRYTPWWHTDSTHTHVPGHSGFKPGHFSVDLEKIKGIFFAKAKIKISFWCQNDNNLHKCDGTL